jgi:hypothetical protein
VFEVDVDATPPCIYHDPGSQLIPRKPFLQLVLWIVGAGVLISLLLVVLAGRTPKLLYLSQSDLHLALEADYEGAVAGKPFSVVALLSNNTGTTAKNVQLEISMRTLADFDLLSVEPPAGALMEKNRWRTIASPTLKAGKTQQVVLRLQPKHAGTKHVIVRLVSYGNVYHGMADLPVLVEEAPESDY